MVVADYRGILIGSFRSALGLPRFVDPSSRVSAEPHHLLHIRHFL